MCRTGEAMSRPLRLLLVEDSERDAAHVALMLKRSGWTPEIRRVETRDQMLAALGESPFEVVVCDYSLPRFSAPEALNVLHDQGFDLPFLIVSGAIGEDVAVDLMRHGASDYLLKDRLARLPLAIERELDQVSIRKAKRRAETFYQSVLRTCPYPSAIVERATGIVIDVSNCFARTFLGDASLSAPQALTALIDFSHPERVEQLIARGSGTAWFAVYRAGGLGHVANVRCTPVGDDDTHLYLVIEDVTEQHYLKAAFDAIAHAVLVVNGEGKLLYANRAAETLFGQLYFGAPVDPLLEVPALEPRWWQKPTTRFEQHRIELQGQPYEAASVAFRFAGDPQVSTILTLRNVAEEEALAQLATHDSLTGAFNTRHFSAVVPYQIELVREGAPAVLALADLDHFKTINDELGHAAGDAALITFANVARSELRPSDIFFRLGGDEFAIVFGGASREEAEAILHRIYERLRTSAVRFDTDARHVTASAGMTSIRSDDSPESVKMRADRALYQAKREGRDRFVVV
jgi:diguanylate cyclase (GGDEF)-like protein